MYFIEEIESKWGLFSFFKYYEHNIITRILYFDLLEQFCNSNENTINTKFILFMERNISFL